MKFLKKISFSAILFTLSIPSFADIMYLQYNKPDPHVLQTSPSVIIHGHLYTCAAPPINGVSISNLPVTTTDIEGIPGAPDMPWIWANPNNPCVANTNVNGSGVTGATVGGFDTGAETISLVTSDTGSGFELQADYASLFNVTFEYDSKDFSFGSTSNCTDNGNTIICCFQTDSGDQCSSSRRR